MTVDITDKARAVLRRTQRTARRRATPALRRAGDAGASALRRLPLPDAVRIRLGLLRLRPGTTRVAVDRLLLGGQYDLTAADFSRRVDDLLWSSTRLADGPHVALLRAFAAGSLDADDDDALLDSPYGRHARRCRDLMGAYFGARTDAELAEVIREQVDPTRLADRTGRTTVDRKGDELPRVRRVKGSSYLQVVDGHHRIARAIVAGSTAVDVRVEWRTGTTALQDHLSEMSWLGGSNELYQPVDAPEVQESWPLVRACRDRLDKMTGFLHEQRIEASTSLDVAAAYGWFVAGFAEAGLEASGVERDPLAVPLGIALYGLEPGQVQTGDAVAFLRDAGRSWDVVSCLSLVHHFAMGLGDVSAEELLRLLDGVTGKVLFLDTGQSHEQWFVGKLDGWDEDGVIEKVLGATTFTTATKLGIDADGIGPYAGNYGRMLYAFTRD